ncbi:MAG TPA: hypothetical protein VMK83_03680 [Gaiellaceae bacterium]|nr:hypothetical protein [Gaiellaceae bacterium]
MNVLAALRPNEWDLPLFVHVFGAMILVGGVLASASVVAAARGNMAMLRTGYFTLLAVALPGWLLMRVGAQWIYDEQGWKAGSEPAWLWIGWLAADPGGALLLVALVLGGVGVRRLGDGRGAGLLKATMWISLILLAAYVVAIWAMSGKPG